MINTEFLQTVLHTINPAVSPGNIQKLNSHFTLQTYKKGAPVLRQGEIWNQVFIIKTGLLRMHFLRKDGREFNKNFFTENQLLCPLTTAMNSSPSLFGISCIEASEIWCCPIDKFTTLLSSTEWLHIQHELLIRLLDGKLKREHDLLALDASQRYQKYCTHFPQLAQ